MRSQNPFIETNLLLQAVVKTVKNLGLRTNEMAKKKLSAIFGHLEF